MCEDIDKAKLATAQEGVTAWAEKLLKDAERYQWLRELSPAMIMISPDLFDAAIDAAMEKNK